MEHIHLDTAGVLDALVSEIHGVLGDGLVGLYLYGSAATGGFDAGVSDLDLAAVTQSEVQSIDLGSLEQMHARFEDLNREWRDRIEVAYIGRQSLESFRTSHGSLAVISPGEPFHVRDDRVGDWLQNWYLIREAGETLYGQSAEEVFPPVEWAEFVSANRRYAEEVQQRSRVGVGSAILAYTILTMCRALRVVRTQTTSSKQEAAAWGREWMPEWAWLIDAALACRLTGGKIGLDDERTREATETFVALVGREISRDVSILSAPNSNSAAH
jgi:hypothetical protein